MSLNQQAKAKGWMVKVRIKRRHRKSLPIRCLQSRPASATVFSFYGYKHEVCWLLQRLNHKTRAYIVNSDGLRGFV